MHSTAHRLPCTIFNRSYISGHKWSSVSTCSCNQTLSLLLAVLPRLQDTQPLVGRCFDVRSGGCYSRVQTSWCFVGFSHDGPSLATRRCAASSSVQPGGTRALVCISYLVHLFFVCPWWLSSLCVFFVAALPFVLSPQCERHMLSVASLCAYCNVMCSVAAGVSTPLKQQGTRRSEGPEALVGRQQTHQIRDIARR
jgi:hypothetical protein